MVDILISPLEADFEQCGSTLIRNIRPPIVPPSPIGVEPCPIGQMLAPRLTHTTTED